MVEIFNNTDFSIGKNFVKKVLEFVFSHEEKSGDVSVAFVKPEEIAKLNEEYRGKEGPTDVLSFPYGDEMLGEIVICPDVVKENSERFQTTFDDEMLLTLVHAALHLCGYDHERSTENAEEMFRRQKGYFNELKRILGG